MLKPSQQSRSLRGTIKRTIHACRGSMKCKRSRVYKKVRELRAVASTTRHPSQPRHQKMFYEMARSM